MTLPFLLAKHVQLMKKIPQAETAQIDLLRLPTVDRTSTACFQLLVSLQHHSPLLP